MLRSLRARFLAVSFATAVAAAGATAWLTSRATSDRVRDSIELTLETDGSIYAALLDHAAGHPDWDGVDDLVRTLADDTGRRIALTTERGRLIVDSARLQGREDVPLPEHAVARIDPLDPIAAAPLAGLPGVESIDVPTYPSAAAELAALSRQAELEADCLTRAGVAFTRSTIGNGRTVIDPRSDDAATWRTTAGCYLSAWQQVVEPLVADAARLYLGERGRRGLTISDAGGGRTLAAVAGVAVLTLAATVAASRRVLRPVAALTAAAQRMEAGDLDPRVDHGGRDEVAQLAHAFNAMADALATNEEQRRRLAGDVAHELRSPLANLRGYIEAAQDGVTPTDPALLALLHEEVGLLHRLVDDLQTLSLAEAGRLPLHPEPVDLGELAAQVVAAFRLAAEAAGVRLATSTPAADATAAHPPPLVEADPVRLRQAVGNLVANALRHTAAGGDVTVGVERDGDAAAVLTVADAGSGIAPDHLPHVFERFWRADTSRTRDTGGSGLGLAICQRLVELHGGKITVTSTLGEGTTFTVRLPRIEA